MDLVFHDMCSTCFQPFCSFFKDKSADFSLTSSVGIKNNILALLVLGVYEVSTQVVLSFKSFFSVEIYFDVLFSLRRE